MTIFTRSNKTSPTEVTVSNRTVVRVILLIVATVLALKVLSLTAGTLTLIFVSAFLAVALNPAVSWIANRLKSKSRVRATAVAYIVLVVPPLVSQTVTFIQDVPNIVHDLQDQDSALGRTIRKYDVDQQLDDFSSDLAGRVKNLQPVFSTAGRIVSSLVSVIAVLVMTFMMLIEGPKWLRSIWDLYPDGKHEDKHRKVAERMYKVVTGYVNGQLLIALIAGIFALIALAIASSVFNVHVNIVALSAIIMLFGLIPMIGNTLGAAVVVLACFVTSFPLALTMAAFFLLYQQIENVTIQPFIQAKSNEMTPLLVFIAALLGASVGGLLGAFVAIPAAGCAKVAFEEYYLQGRQPVTRESVTK
jgi:predicted PurR-regulated permease PerM